MIKLSKRTEDQELIASLKDTIREMAANERDLKMEIRLLKKEKEDLERQLEPYLDPKTTMNYAITAADKKYSVVSDCYHYHHSFGSSRVEFFLGQRRVADFSSVDEIIGFAIEDKDA